MPSTRGVAYPPPVPDAAAEQLPRFIAPTLASAGPAPTDTGWALEVKWDGIRAQLRYDGRRVCVLASRPRLHRRVPGAGRDRRRARESAGDRCRRARLSRPGLSTPHDSQDPKVFDTVVVITDRVILDRQLQDTIYQARPRPGRRDRPGLGAAGAGARRRAGADHHHDAAEVPVRDRQARRAAGPQLHDRDQRGALLAGQRGGQDLRVALGGRGGAGADRRRGGGCRASWRWRSPTGSADSTWAGNLMPVGLRSPDVAW